MAEDSEYTKAVKAGAQLIDDEYDGYLRNARTPDEGMRIEELRRAAHREFTEYVMAWATRNLAPPDQIWRR